MNRQIATAVTGIALGASLIFLPVVASARGHVGIGIGIGVPGPHYYGGARYYSPPAYYYGPSYYYPPEVIYEEAPPVVYESDAVVPAEPPQAFWYYCLPAQAYFPYVRECPGGWQAVPAPERKMADKRRPAPAPAGRVTYRLGDVLFRTGRSELEPAAMDTLDSLLASIENEPNRRIVIEGHTDAVGDDENNLSLSRARAEEVKAYLIERGVRAGRITAVGKGEAGAIADNATAEGRQQNRRVDVIVS